MHIRHIMHLSRLPQSPGRRWTRPTSGRPRTTPATSSVSTKCSKGTTERSSSETGCTGQVSSHTQYSLDWLCIYISHSNRSRSEWSHGKINMSLVQWINICIHLRSENVVQESSPKCWVEAADSAQVCHGAQCELHFAGGVQPFPGQHKPGIKPAIFDSKSQRRGLLLP